MDNDKRGKYKLTPDIVIKPKSVYIVRIDNDQTRKCKEYGEVCYTRCEDDARLMVDSIANAEVKRLKKENNKVLKENITDPYPFLMKVDIFVQEIGMLYNSSLTKVESIGYVKINSSEYIGKQKREARINEKKQEPRSDSKIFRAERAERSEKERSEL